MNTRIQLVAMSAVFSLSIGAASAKVPDCFAVSKTVKEAVIKDKASVLAIVEREVKAAPDCACEVVRAAIASSEASKELVGEIATVAMTAVPEKMRLIAQCAIAVAPDALASVQSSLSKFEAAAGETVSYSSKGGGGKAPVEVADAADSNPLDFPIGTEGVVAGPQAGIGLPGGVIIPEFVDVLPDAPPEQTESEGGPYNGISF